MHSLAHALPRTRPPAYFVEDPSFWVVRFPCSEGPVVLNYDPGSDARELIGTADKECVAELIAKDWERQRERRLKLINDALWVGAAALLVTAVLCLPYA